MRGELGKSLGSDDPRMEWDREMGALTAGTHAQARARRGQATARCAALRTFGPAGERDSGDVRGESSTRPQGRRAFYAAACDKLEREQP